MGQQALEVVVLAAGKGTRMRSSKPKVLHEALGRPMLHYVFEIGRALSPKQIVAVIGHGRDQVEAACTNYSDVKICVQSEQLGTGHAVQVTEKFFPEKSGDLLVLSGDVILLRPETLKAALTQHREQGAVATVLTAKLENPSGYGRILRNSKQDLVAIREERDCNGQERAVQEVNSGIYFFNTSEVFSALSKINKNNAQGEYYLTDVLGILVQEGKRVLPFLMENAEEMTGVNDRMALSGVEQVLQRRINESWMLKGVTIRNSEAVFIDPSCEIGNDVMIEGPATLIHCQIGSDVWIEPLVRAVECRIGEGTHIKQGCYFEKSVIEKNCSVGPYAHLRPGSHLGDEVKIGNFVELKKTSMAKGAKASHLSYIGDATVGENVNIGCGFITCNFDGGKKKHETIIERDVFIGSDSQSVAPVRIGSGSYIASGSTVTEDVPPDSLVISRGKQITKPGYAKKYRSK